VRTHATKMKQAVGPVELRQFYANVNTLGWMGRPN